MQVNKPNLFKHSTLTQEQFLKDYWHKKPLLLKEVFTNKQLAFLPNKKELIDLSCNQDIQSRIVIKNSETDYEVEVGPFVKEDFNELNNFIWNLLVSDIDKWQPESRQLLNYFDFIRNWVFDDIMISTGSIGGTVGPHTDHYDVFLIQVCGQRQWQFGHNKIYNPDLLNDVELKLLDKFEADENYTLKPGDVLYLPPEVAHYGIATSDDCITCSIGMRTPSTSELLTSFVDGLAEKLSENDRFEEPQFHQHPAIGEITQQDIEKVKKILIENISINDLSHWFGKYLSSYRNIFHEFNQYNQPDDIKDKNNLCLNPFSKACYYTNKGETTLFINGDAYQCSLNLAQLVCNDKELTSDNLENLNDNDMTVVKSLFENGAIEKKSVN